jgi:hypothetical protein
LEGTSFYPWNFVVAGYTHQQHLNSRLGFLAAAARDFGIEGVKLGILDRTEDILALWDMVVSGSCCRDESRLALEIFCHLNDSLVFKVMFDSRSATLDFVNLDGAGYSFVLACFKSVFHTGVIYLGKG